MPQHTDITDHITELLAKQGWAVVPDFIPAPLVTELAHEAQQLKQNGIPRPAGIGKGAERTVNTDIRGDAILWLNEPDLTDAQSKYFASLEELRMASNAALQLGLFEFEGHLAIYPPGAFYQRHLDRFRNDSLRTQTAILYLNTDWQEEQGGQLRMYLNDTEYIDILPQAGTLVTFLSERYWHEVLPANRERMSITGWFKTRSGTVL